MQQNLRENINQHNNLNSCDINTKKRDSLKLSLFFFYITNCYSSNLADSGMITKIYLFFIKIFPIFAKLNKSYQKLPKLFKY